MSDQRTTASPLKVILGSIGILVFFGFLVLILSGFAGHESLEDRAYMGDFDPETIETRWSNLEEIKETQAGLIDTAKVDAALAELVKSAPKASKSDVVLPGSPTFMKQMEAASSPEEKPAEGEKPAAPAEAKPTAEEAPAASAEKKPEAPKEKPAEAEKPAAPAEKPAQEKAE